MSAAGSSIFSVIIGVVPVSSGPRTAAGSICREYAPSTLRCKVHCESCWKWGGCGTAGLARLWVCVPFRRDELSRVVVGRSPHRLAALLGPHRRPGPPLAEGPEGGTC